MNRFRKREELSVAGTPIRLHEEYMNCDYENFPCIKNEKYSEDGKNTESFKFQQFINWREPKWTEESDEARIHNKQSFDIYYTEDQFKMWCDMLKLYQVPPKSATKVF